MSDRYPVGRQRLGRPPSARVIHRRLVGLCLVFFLMFGAVVVRLADVQVLHPDSYVNLGVRQRFVSKTLPAGRGSLLDRNGVELALSLPQQSVFADPLLVTTKGRIHETAAALAPLLSMDVADLETRITGKGRYVLLAHTVPDSVAAKIAALGLTGIGTFDEFKRYQPSGDVARSVLGRVSDDGSVGSSGLEEQYDSVLAGRPGKISYERRGTAEGSDTDGVRIAGGRQHVDEAKPGADLVLTLDRAMQYEAERVLTERVAATGAKGGMAIISRPATGEILAMANVSADPRPDGALGPAEPSSNNASLTTTFEPGSVNKVITLAAALESGVTTPSTGMEVPDHYTVADHEFTDDHNHEPEVWTPTDILVSSSNVGTIKIAQQLGDDRLDAALRRFGLGAPTGLDFPRETRGRLLDPEEWSGTSLGSIAIGQGISVTAMQMLGAFNVIANDGTYVAPRLVDATVGPDGTRRKTPVGARRRVVSEDTARTMQAMMAKVVSEQSGTGTRAQVPGYTVAGKTGTARKPMTPSMPDDGYKDLQGRYHYVATFAGFVPAEQPELSIIVVIDEPTTEYYASDVSAPAFSELARYALRRYDIPPAAVRAQAEVPEVSASARGVGDTPVPVPEDALERGRLTVRLDELLGTLGARPGLSGLIVDERHIDLSSVEILSVTHDSAAAEHGTLFCCVPGRQTDGHDFAAAAVEAGAVALLAERRLDLPVPQLLVSSVRAAMGLVASAFHGDPSQRVPVIGVTGTNGKTTVCHLVASIFEASGRPSGVIGTLSGPRTTPEATDLQAQLAEFARSGAAVAVEVSSHALVQHRVDGTRFAIAGFTNLSQDHLDYHGTMEAYFDAKARLFEPGRADRAVVCLDDPHGRLLRDAAQIPTVGYRAADASSVQVTPRGTSFTWRGVPMETPLVGRFNLLNAIAAATITAELGLEPGVIAKGLAGASPVPGRFELVDAGQPFLAVVDYAHTPDGLTQALAAARELAEGGRVIVVFGCGGDRDPSKRPRMGAAAAEGADVAVVTSDNPRYEHPDAIIEEVLTGFGHDDQPLVQPDRRLAIAAALAMARTRDVVLVAGKGHEAVQVIGDREEPFDDRQVVREEWAARGHGAAPGR